LNTRILNKNVQDFINANLKSDITKLVLKGSPFTAVSIQEIAEQITSKSKCEKKLPKWFNTKNIYYPNKLNIEQASSEKTAKFKANLVSGKNLIDITGGFGVDALYFSQILETVTHCETNSDLSAIVTHNLQKFNVHNITTYLGDGIEYALKYKKKIDWIYADSSRRNLDQRKVFLLEDCVPNIPKHIDPLLNISNNILLKFSPMLDIASTVKELKNVKEIHVVAVNNEVKELLLLIKKNYLQPINIQTINLTKNTTQEFNFPLFEEATATFSEPKKYLYEPNSAILKSGGFNQVSKKYKIAKLHQHTHLYTADNLIEFPGRNFKILDSIPFEKKLLKKLLPSNKANISTRNFPLTVSQIRKKTKIKDGGNKYLFFTTNILNKHIILICEKV
jgi:precorrin-6B methylase 2